MTETKQIIHLHLICHNPPQSTFIGVAASRFGLQDKKGALNLGETQIDGSRLFTCDIATKMSSESIDFSGIDVQGTKGSRFLYLSWAYDAGGWVQRIKVPLSGITPELIRSGSVLQAVIEDGRASATVKPKYGWNTV